MTNVIYVSNCVPRSDRHVWVYLVTCCMAYMEVLNYGRVRMCGYYHANVMTTCAIYILFRAYVCYGMYVDMYSQVITA